MYKGGGFSVGVIVGQLITAVLMAVGFSLWPKLKASEACPTLIEHAPDTLALIQGFPKCLPYITEPPK